MIASDQLVRLRGLETHLRAHLLGQDHVIRRTAAVFSRGEMGLCSRDRPRGTLLAVGPTGTGKTELIRLTSTYLFGPHRLCRLDLSEYQRDDAIERLLGTNSSTAGVFHRFLAVPSPRVWLFDELEKAHAKVYDLFIQMLEPGTLTLADGTVVSFVDDYLAFTSNLGASESVRMARSSPATIEQATLRRISECLRPEIVGRITEKLVFTRLSADTQREIAHLHLASEISRLHGAGFDLEVTPAALEFLIREGFHPHLGARPLRQTIERQLQDAVVHSLFSSGVGSGRIELSPTGNFLRLIPR